MFESAKHSHSARFVSTNTCIYVCVRICIYLGVGFPQPCSRRHAALVAFITFQLLRLKHCQRLQPFPEPIRPLRVRDFVAVVRSAAAWRSKEGAAQRLHERGIVLGYWRLVRSPFCSPIAAAVAHEVDHGRELAEENGVVYFALICRHGRGLYERRKSKEKRGEHSTQVCRKLETQMLQGIKNSRQ